MIVMEGDYGVAWHCGAAPCALCKSGYQPKLCHSATVEGGGVKGVTDEFPLKPGKMSRNEVQKDITRFDGDFFHVADKEFSEQKPAEVFFSPGKVLFLFFY